MIAYRALAEHRLLVFCCWGKTSVEDIERLRRDIRNDPDFPQGYDAILEVSHLERWYTHAELEAFAISMSDPVAADRKLAVVASTDIAYGVNRMFQAMADSESTLEMNVFRDARSALAWLEREDFDIESVFREMMGE